MTTDSAVEELERLGSIFEDRKAELRCPVCGNETMVMLDSAAKPERSGIATFRFQSQAARQSSAIETVSVACNNCGLVRQFVKNILMRAGTDIET
jgi:ribosomal protein S27E